MDGHDLTALDQLEPVVVVDNEIDTLSSVATRRASAGRDTCSPRHEPTGS